MEMELNGYEQAHIAFYRLMQDVEEVTCNAWADAKSEAEREAVRDFESEINAAIRAQNVDEQLVNLRRVIEKYGIQL